MIVRMLCDITADRILSTPVPTPELRQEVRGRALAVQGGTAYTPCYRVPLVKDRIVSAMIRAGASNERYQ